MDVLGALREEVALEGLDGITLPALWFRLQTRVPPFPLNLDSATKSFLWQSLVCDQELELYRLPEDRKPLIISNRYEEIDYETMALKTNSSDYVDIYPVHIIVDNKNGIHGSCQFFKERLLVTEQVRTQSITYDEAINRWGEKLVIVASQLLRFRHLIGWEGDPDLELPDYSYCILERVGRSRWQGELQKDLQLTFKVDAGKIHYLRRVLDKNGLVTMQSHVIRLPNGTQQHSLLLLLKRFHKDRRNKYDILAEKLSGMLSECDNKLETLVNLREGLCVQDRLFKRLYQYMSSAGVVKVLNLPLHEVQPSAEHLKTKKGHDIMVRCLKLIKEYKRKEDEFDEEEDEDASKTPIFTVEQIYEKDMLTQTYELIENRGTKGISQREIQKAMNIGKLEARMLCRLLERYKLIKGFMEDEGRQRTTKFISHVFVEESDIRRQYLEEKAKSEKLCTLGPVTTQTAAEDKVTSPAVNPCAEDEVEISDTDNAEELNLSKEGKKTEKGVLMRQISSGSSPRRSTPKVQSRILRLTASSTEPDKSFVLSENECSRDSFQFESNLSAGEDDVSVIEEVMEKVPERKRSKKKRYASEIFDRNRETYRLLKRRNTILETVSNLRLVESLFTLQKMITDQEKQEGVPTRCCKKSILRLVQRLSQEGLLRLYRTTVVQDGISKKVELVVHPSINPTDPLVKSAIEQIRFRISSSSAAIRTRPPPGPLSPSKTDANDQSKDISKEEPQNPSSSHKDSPNKFPRKRDQKMGVTQLTNYHPVIVPGLGRTLGFLPKMLRLKLTHLFVWYVVYGHPLHKHLQHLSSQDASSNDNAQKEQENLESSESTPNTLPSTQSFDCDEQIFDPGEEQKADTVYVDELTWMRHVPPATVYKEYGPGWALVSDVLLCLPLSVFIQIVQISYQIENLDEFLNDPLKKHILIRHLPTAIRQQLVYKRRYIFSFVKGLQKLSCMGLLQFGPTEKFQDKDQAFVYVKTNATVMDTTTCDPHYNIAHGNHPFEKRLYHLETLQDVENYWFDLQFVCLNTPLGVVRFPRIKKTNPDETLTGPDLDIEQEDRYILEHRRGFLESVGGSREVLDDGSIPGDGLGAGGLDSSFFGHLKRNWIWISYVINKDPKEKTPPDSGLTLRLQTFLNKYTLPKRPAGNRSGLFGDINMEANGELVQVVRENAELRRHRVCGGKGQKRKRPKKDNGKKKTAKKKKSEISESEKTKKNRYHDEADQSALQRMTRQRVAWTSQEDGLLVLCRIASNILNRKVKRPFVPWQVVRDIMHSSMEESLDKTSHSIGRRARYIMKNPQTYLNYKVCLAEVYQDRILVDDFMTRKDNYEDPKVCAAEFKDFVESLKRKFSTNLGQPINEMPDTVHQLFNRYRVLAVGDVSNEEGKIETLESVTDVHLLVLQNLILSTLALSDMQMKYCRSFQTFRLFKAYPDDIVLKAFHEFQKRRLVNRRRGNHMLGPKKNRALPFAPMSFQLSQMYYRLFTWRFPSPLCTQAFEFLESLKACGRADQLDLYSFSDQVNEAADDMVLFSLDGPGGHCVTILSLLFLGLIAVNVKIPDQIVVVDTNLVENEVVKSIGKECLDDEDDDDEEVDEAMGSKRKIEVKARQASHTNYLLMRGYCAPGIISMRNLSTNDNVVVNSCQVHVKLRNTPLQGRLGDAVDAVLAEVPCLPNHFTGCVNTKESSFEKFLNLCVENLGYSQSDISCVGEIHSAIKAASFCGIKVIDLGKRFFQYEDVEMERTRCLQQYIQDLVTHEQVLQVGGVSIRLVAIANTGPWLLKADCVNEQMMQERPPFNLSKDTDGSETALGTVQNQTEDGDRSLEIPQKKAHLEDCDTAVQSILDNTDKSVVPKEDLSFKANESFMQRSDTGDSISTLHDRGSDYHFMGRPWKIVDGNLNKPVCKGMLEAVLYHIMTKPGIPEATLLQHYSGVIQPVIVLELLQVLEQLGCIKKCYVEKSSKASLFSRPVTPEEIKKPKLCDDLSAFYEPTVDCTLRLGGIFPSVPNWNKWVPV
ncbi:general transcription factor 3C polypeptide 1 [Discoglossus pictus]